MRGRYENVKVDLTYVNYIMKETLRIRPSAAFTKQAVTDITLPGSDDSSYCIILSFSSFSSL